MGYIKQFNWTGDSIINFGLVCKKWDDRFSITTWANENEVKYTFIIKSKRKNQTLSKTQISKEQALAVVDRLKLIHIKDPHFRSGGAFHTESFIRSEVERIGKIVKEKEEELSVISSVLYEYKKHI